MVAAKRQNTETNPAEGLIAVLAQGILLIESLSDEAFADGRSVSSVGVHFRHNLDFVTAFLDGLKMGRIDYGARLRDERVASERPWASAMMREAVNRVREVETNDLERRIAVRSETDPDIWCESSGLRELDFVLSHTVHHYALVATRLETQGVKVPENFGVAPSTIRYWNSQKGETQ